MLIADRTAQWMRGFSIVELMITIAIIALALALGAPAFSTWIQNTQVRTVAESVQNGLQLARNEALRCNCNVEFTLATDTGWTVIAKVANVAGSTYDDVPIQERKSQDGSTSTVTASLTPAGATAVFNGLGRLDNSTPLTTVNVASSSGTKALRIDIGSGGQIRMCDPAVTDTTDPRKCK